MDMTVNITGIYLSALEKLADKYNKKTLEMWDKGITLFLREKQTAEKILPNVIIDFVRREHPDIYKELTKELDDVINEHFQKISQNGKLTTAEHVKYTNCLESRIKLSTVETDAYEEKKLLEEEKE